MRTMPHLFCRLLFPIFVLLHPTVALLASELEATLSNVTLEEDRAKGEQWIKFFTTVMKTRAFGDRSVSVDRPSVTATMEEVDLVVEPTQGVPDERPGIVVAFLVDLSGSMRGEPFDKLKEALSTTIAGLQAQDAYMIIGFGDSITVLQELTRDKTLIGNAISAMFADSSSTRLYDAVARGARALKSVQGIKTMVVFSDGHDEGSLNTDFGALMKEVRESGITVHGFGFSPDRQSSWLEVMKQMSAESGGVFYPLDEPAVFGAVFKTVAEQLARQVPVPLGYRVRVPREYEDGKKHGLTVRFAVEGMQTSKSASVTTLPHSLTPQERDDLAAAEQKKAGELKRRIEEQADAHKKELEQQSRESQEAQKRLEETQRKTEAEFERSQENDRLERQERENTYFLVGGAVAGVLLLAIVLLIVFGAARRKADAKICKVCGATRASPDEPCSDCLRAERERLAQVKKEAVREAAAASAANKTILCRLVAQSGPLTGKQFGVTERTARMGRDAGACQVVFPEEDQGISRQHAEVYWVNGEWRIRNLSRAGVLVNGVSVDDYPLRHGDRMQLGKTEFQFLC